MLSLEQGLGLQGLRWAVASGRRFSPLQTHTNLTRVANSAFSPAFSPQGSFMCSPFPHFQPMPNSLLLLSSVSLQAYPLPASPSFSSSSCCLHLLSLVLPHLHSLSPSIPFVLPSHACLQDLFMLSMPGFLFLNPIWHAFALSSSHLTPLHKINFNET